MNLDWFQLVEAAYRDYGHPYAIGKSSKEVSSGDGRDLGAMRRLILASLADADNAEAMALLEELLWEHSLLADPLSVAVTVGMPPANDLGPLNSALEALLASPPGGEKRNKGEFITANKGDFITARQALGLPTKPTRSTTSMGQSMSANLGSAGTGTGLAMQHGGPKARRLGMKRICDEPPSEATVRMPMTTAAPPQTQPIDERLVGMDPKLIEMIQSEIMHRVDHIGWDSIAGLEHAKATLREIIIWPMLRP